LETDIKKWDETEEDVLTGGMQLANWTMVLSC